MEYVNTPEKSVKEGEDLGIVADWIKKKLEAKKDAGKHKLSLVPRDIIYDIARVREYGVKKYGDPENYKNVEAVRYRDAAFRHYLRYLDEPDGVDEESGLPHLWHVACNIAFLCEFEDKKNPWWDEITV